MCINNKTSLCIWIWLLISCANIWAKDVPMTYTTYFGRRKGTDTQAVYNTIPNKPYNKESGWVHKDAVTNRMYEGTPAFKRTDLTSYSIYSGENGNATKTVFKYTIEMAYSILYIYHSEEVLFGKSRHAPLYLSYVVQIGSDTIGCPYRLSYADNNDTIGTGFHYLFSDSIGGKAGYVDWHVMALDLTEYIGQEVTITAEATCCSDQSCRSRLSMAFEMACIARGVCDEPYLRAPSYCQPFWLDNQYDILSFDEYLPVDNEDSLAVYHCFLNDSCSDILTFYNVGMCLCREQAEYNLIDTIVPHSHLPLEWHGYLFTDSDSMYVDTIRAQLGCDSIITFYSMKYVYCSPMLSLPVQDTIVCDTLMPYIWHGHEFTFAGEIWRDTLRNRWECDSVEYIYRLDTIHCERPCEKNIVYRKWQDFLFCDNGELDQVSYQWYRDDEKLIGETNQFLFVAGGFDTMSSYYVAIKRQDGTTVITCPATFDKIAASASTYGTIYAIPGRRSWVHVSVPDDEAVITVWNVMGCLLYSATIHRETEFYLPMSGTCIISLQGPQSESIHKLLLQ